MGGKDINSAFIIRFQVDLLGRIKDCAIKNIKEVTKFCTVFLERVLGFVLFLN